MNDSRVYSDLMNQIKSVPSCKQCVRSVGVGAGGLLCGWFKVTIVPNERHDRVASERFDEFARQQASACPQYQREPGAQA